MALIAEFTVPAETFAIGRALSDLDEARVELERIVPTDQTMIPFFWAWGTGEHPAFEERLVADYAVESVERLAETGDGTLYRVTWTGDISSMIRKLFELEFTILSGTATPERWEFEVRFPSSSAAGTFQSFLNENDVPYELDRVNSLVEASDGRDYDLSAEQREALVAAYEEGYFEEPRGVTQRELAAALDIAPASLSGRLRRGFSNLVENTLLRPQDGSH